jgi:hypothetical protein
MSIRWPDILLSLEPADFEELRVILEEEYGRKFTDLEVRDAARRLCSLADLFTLTETQPEGVLGKRTGERPEETHS